MQGTTDYAYSGLLYQLFEYQPFQEMLDTDLNVGVVDIRPSRNLAKLSQIIGKFEYLHRVDTLNGKYININTEKFFNLYIRLLYDGGITEYEDDSEYAPSGCVSFLTIHQSKGMEFPIVVVDSLSNVPRTRNNDLMLQIEARYFKRPAFEPYDQTKYFDFWRLYYTAFSRAQDLLILTCNEDKRTPSNYFREQYGELQSVDGDDFQLTEFDFKPIKDVNLKRKFAFTSNITVYDTCALQYKFYKELEFMPVRANAMLFGTLVHETIEDIHRAAIRHPTQKPEELLKRIISIASNPDDIVFDCFMGSGTTQAVAMKLGRRFIGADINLGAIQTTTKRLVGVANELNSQMQEETKYTGFEVYNVNNYDFFRNPVEARDLLIQALEIQPFPQSNVWDGELDGRMVKIMPVNRIATKADLKELLANLPYTTYEKRKEENPNQPVEHMTIVCMGHEPDLKGSLEQELSNYKVDVQILDVLRDKADLQLKRDSEAEIVREGNKLVIREFFPMNLMQKLSLQKEYVEEWRQLVDSVMIDWNYDGAVMQPRTIDIPEKNELVKGVYDIPEDAGTIKVKITDLLSESLEVEVR